MDFAANFSLGDKITQFIETENGGMGMLEGVVSAIFEDKIIYKENTSEKEHIVTVDMFETLL